MKTFSVMVEVHVKAPSKQKAEDEVNSMMAYAFEVSNDEEIFDCYFLGDEVGKTHEVGEGAAPARTRGQTALDLD